MQVSQKLALIGTKPGQKAPEKKPETGKLEAKKTQSTHPAGAQDMVDIKFPNKKKTAGSLHVLDNFHEGETPSHGQGVTDSAKTAGFQGTIVPSEINKYSNTEFFQEKKALDKLGASKLDKNGALGALDDYVEGGAVGTLKMETDYIKDLKSQGVQDSAVNLSQGYSKSFTAYSLYSSAFDDLDPKYAHVVSAKEKQTAQTKVQNFATAFDLNADKLLSTDTKISGPEKQRLQQALVDHVSEVHEHSGDIGAAKDSWAQTVQGFEAQNNSVVASAGNFGQFDQGLQAQNPGFSVDFPGDSQANILGTPGLTLVGATDNSQQPAASSGFTTSSQVYAPSNSASNFSTSFASPKVAGAAAWAHGAHIGSSSENVEGFLQHNSYDQVDSPNGTIKVFNPQKFQMLQDAKAQDDWKKSSPTFFL